MQTSRITLQHTPPRYYAPDPDKNCLQISEDSRGEPGLAGKSVKVPLSRLRFKSVSVWAVFTRLLYLVKPTRPQAQTLSPLSWRLFVLEPQYCFIFSHKMIQSGSNCCKQAQLHPFLPWEEFQTSSQCLEMKCGELNSVLETVNLNFMLELILLLYEWSNLSIETAAHPLTGPRESVQT